MKIAVCLRGDFRNWDIMKKYFFHVFSSMNHDIDFYFATYDNVNYVHKKRQYEGVGDTFNYAVPFRLDKVLMDFKQYNLVDYQIVPSSERKWLSGPINPTLFQYHLIYLSNLLKRKHEINNNFKYDVVISTRTDVFYFEDLLLKAVDNSKSMFLNHHDSKDRLSPPFNFNAQDIAFISDSETMDIVSNIYWEIRQFLHGGHTREYCTHGWLSIYLRQNGITGYYPPIRDLYRRCGMVNKAWHCDENGPCDQTIRTLAKDWFGVGK